MITGMMAQISMSDLDLVFCFAAFPLDLSWGSWEEAIATLCSQWLAAGRGS